MPNKHCDLKTCGGEDPFPPPLKFDKRWSSLVIPVEAVPISGPVCSRVDMVMRKFTDTIGNRTMLLELVSDHGDVSDYVSVLQGILLLFLPLRFTE